MINLSFIFQSTIYKFDPIASKSLFLIKRKIEIRTKYINHKLEWKAFAIVPLDE